MTFHERLATNKVLHATKVTPKTIDFHGRELRERNTRFIHPPRPAPRRMTSLPSPSTIFVPDTLRYEVMGSDSLERLRTESHANDWEKG